MPTMKSVCDLLKHRGELRKKLRQHYLDSDGKRHQFTESWNPRLGRGYATDSTATRTPVMVKWSTDGEKVVVSIEVVPEYLEGARAWGRHVKAALKKEVGERRLKIDLTTTKKIS